MPTGWTQYEEIWLAPSLQEGGTERAVTVLKQYFGRTESGQFLFTGGAWDSFDPSGTRDASANVFTADDVLSCTLLSTPIGAAAALQLLNPAEDNEFSELLPAIRTGLDFVDESWSNSDGFKAANELFERLKNLPGVGLTRTTKLFARKRPRLVPIIDSVVLRDVLHGSKSHWQPLSTAFQANERALWRRLVGIHGAAGLSSEVSTLRIFDVLSWMEGAGYADRIVARAEIVPPDDGTQRDVDVTAP